MSRSRTPSSDAGWLQHLLAFVHTLVMQIQETKPAASVAKMVFLWVAVCCSGAGHVWVANHTTMIDYVVLSSYHAFAVIMQLHPGWVGFLQTQVLNSLNCLWFNRTQVQVALCVSGGPAQHGQFCSALLALLAGCVHKRTPCAGWNGVHHVAHARVKNFTSHVHNLDSGELDLTCQKAFGGAPFKMCCGRPCPCPFPLCAGAGQDACRQEDVRTRPQ